MAKRVKLRPLRINRGKWLTGEACAEFSEVNDELHDEAAKEAETGKFVPVKAVPFILESSLLDKHTGMMCCLGFACLAVGVPMTKIKGEGMPGSVAKKKGVAKRLKQALVEANLASFNHNYQDYGETGTCESLASINDTEDTKRRAREKAVKEGFRTMGWKVTFVGKYPDYNKLARRYAK